MLLVDTIYINDGGGKVLLDYLIKKIESTETKCFYLFDSRIKNNHPNIKPSNQVLYLKPSLWDRFLFYRKHTASFSKIFCMGNLPPNIKMNAEVFTYYHSPLYLKNPEDFSTIERLKYALKRLVLKRFIKNTNFWMAQTAFIKQKFEEKFDVNQNKVMLMPFFPPFGASNKDTHRAINTFLYVSNATTHKNHNRLIDAFCDFFDEYQTGTLTLTVSEEYKDVSDIIKKRLAEGYPIVNVGFIGRTELQTLYLSSQYLIFPSLAESFGLGLVEAINNGCKVIGADLPYTYAVCEPSIVFNPHVEESIVDAFKKAVHEDVKMSKSLMENKIDELIKLLT